MSYRIAGIDVHKKMHALVMTDVSEGGEYTFERCKFGGSPSDLRTMAQWLIDKGVQEVVMESTAQYWRPVWQALEQHWQPECRKLGGGGAAASGAGRIQSGAVWTESGISKMPNGW